MAGIIKPQPYLRSTIIFEIMLSRGIDMKAELSIGEVAKRSGITISAIHFYEDKGLIQSGRNSANHRRYARVVLRKLAIIKIAQSAGIPLSEIYDALSSITNSKTITVDDWDRLSKTWRNQLDHRIEALSRLRDNFSQCIGCGCLSMEKCQLMNPEDKLREKGCGSKILEPEDLD